MRALTNSLFRHLQSRNCALARGTRSTNEDAELAKKIFNAIGLAVDVDEEHIDAVTALAGSGPAFVYSVIEALAEGGKKCGLGDEVALTLAAQTVLGAAELAIQEAKCHRRAI